MATVLVTGVAGGLAQLVARRLIKNGDTVIGVDYRPVAPRKLEGMLVYRASYNKTGIEDVFRHHKIDKVLHLGRVGDLSHDTERRFDLNVVGTQKIMNLCLANRVKRLVVLSTFHIYGAHPANHTPIYEDDPLRAGLDFPEIGDAIQLDNMASTWVYKHKEVSTAVVRMVNMVGPNINNTMSRFLRSSWVPHLMGFNPMIQFIHEHDAASALIAAANSDVAGVFNVAGADTVPWRTILKLAEAKLFPVPPPMVTAYLKLRRTLPGYLINFFRYPCVISDRAFREAFQWQPEVGIEETIWSTVAETRMRQRMHR